MKKLLGIIVLGLLLSGNAYAAEYTYTYKNYFDMTVSGVASAKWGGEASGSARSICQEKS